MKKGFSLIELMVVVAILSVAAAIIVPRFLKDEIRKRQEECHRNLRSLFILEKGYFEKKGVWSEDLQELGWSPSAKRWHEYRFLPPPLAGKGFLFECSGNIDKDPTVDKAVIDESGTIRQISEDRTR